MITAQERLARIKLNAFIYLRSDWVNRLLEVFGGAEQILKKSAKELAREGRLTLETAEHLLKEAHALDAEKEAELVEKAGGQILLFEDDAYPEDLKNIKEPPFVLYVRGSLSAAGPKVAMVGSRGITPYGNRCAAKFAGEVTERGCVVVSGLARGVDSACHKAAVDLQKPTWAVIGTGIGRCYPAENKFLAGKILEYGGAIISELPFEKPPHAFHFPRRNRIIAGLSCVTAVIEARLKSGALITAKLALEQGKDVLAVPGSVESLESEGTNMLLKNGAGVLLETEDIIYNIPSQYAFGLKEAEQKKEKTDFENLPEEEKAALAFIGDAEQSLDNIALALNKSVPETAGIMFELEIKGEVACTGALYSRSKFKK